MFGLDIFFNPTIGSIVLKIAIALGLFSGLIFIIHSNWSESSRPKWLETLYGYTKNFIGIPKWIIKFFIINPCRIALALQESLIETAKKMRSRSYQAFVAVFYLVYKCIELAAKIKDPQLLFGAASLVGAAAALMMYVTKRLIDSRDKDHDHVHEMAKKVLENGNGYSGDAPNDPPGPELSVTPKVSKAKKKRR